MLLRTPGARLAVLLALVWGVTALAGPDGGTATCYRGGCSGELCSEKANLTSTCQWRPEYECLKGSPCERQRDGRCGLTETAESRRCKAKLKPSPGSDVQ